MDPIAEEYVRLALALGKHDADYVDAYYGPPAWRAEADASLPEIRGRAGKARAAIGEEGPRARFLAKALEALDARARMVGGERMAFDEESRALYDVVAPSLPDAHYAAAVRELEGLLPGDAPLGERFEGLRARFEVPADRLPAVFDAAIDAARARTKRHLDLPEGESFRTEYVEEKVWGAYNWYEGGARSLIQVNTDSPTAIDAPVPLACHEGYPGHHAHNALLESRLAKGKGWVEFTVYPLYGPQSLLAEGIAEYGVDLCFPKAERRPFERETLLPLAGLDPGGLDEYERARDLAKDLAGAGTDAARRLLDGERGREESVEWLVAHTLMTPERADRALRFVEHNRAYIVTYGVGKDLVEGYVESRAQGDDRWRVFAELMSSPAVPSDLTA